MYVQDPCPVRRQLYNHIILYNFPGLTDFAKASLVIGETLTETPGFVVGSACSFIQAL